MAMVAGGQHHEVGIGVLTLRWAHMKLKGDFFGPLLRVING
jgi:hypothetical protein